MGYLDNLNEKQQEAVLHTRGPLLILAGAGSGKTTTMTSRIAYLIDEKGVNPNKILAVTFTNKAAREMKERVARLVAGSENMWIMTFHSAALRMLRRNAERIGYTNAFVVYDPTDQKTVIKAILKEKDLSEKDYPVRSLLATISKMKEQSINPNRAKVEASSVREEKIAEIYAKYVNTLKGNNAMDFDDLLSNAVKLFKENEDVLSHYQDRFEYIMVDEYQDTNAIQYQFVKMLADKNNNICVVGDDDQCIYEWRGADIRNILDFEKDFKDAKVIKLEQNYRSTSNILDAAHSIITRNRGRKDKKLWTTAPKGEQVTYKRLDTDKDEASHIAYTIKRLIADGHSLNDFAILYRNNVQSRLFEDALTMLDIPYKVMGGLRYYDRLEVKDIVSYMRLILNPKDDVAFVRIINSPKRGIGKASLDKWKATANLLGISLFDVIDDDVFISSLTSKSRDGVRDFVDMIKDFNELKDKVSIEGLYEGILAKSGYLQALRNQNTVEADARIENLLEFKGVIRDAEEIVKAENDGEMNLGDFLEKITLVSDVDSHDENEDVVALMTMHSAKGLEFPYVFMPGMEDGLFPGYRAMQSGDELEQERRLCYVGMTRAKQKLVMTGAGYRALYGEGQYTRESRFLLEIDPNLIDGSVYRNDPARTFGEQKSMDGFNTTRRFNPYAGLNKKKIEAPQKVDRSIELEPGDKVLHAKFGAGTVSEVSGIAVTVNFEDGSTKKLATTAAPLTKL